MVNFKKQNLTGMDKKKYMKFTEIYMGFICLLRFILDFNDLYMGFMMFFIWDLDADG